MAVEEVPVRFKASDGEEFDTKEEAEVHDKLVTAKRELDAARTSWMYVLAQTQKTADGKMFKWAKGGDYFYVNEGWAGVPEIERVSFYYYNCTVHENDTISITQSKNGREVEYHVSRLYTDERSAERALLVKREEWLAEQAKEVEELRKRIAPSR